MSDDKLVEFEGYMRSEEFVSNALGLRKAMSDLNEQPQLLSALDVAKKLANVGGIDRWALILQEWMDSYIDRWKEEEKLRKRENDPRRLAVLYGNRKFTK